MMLRRKEKQKARLSKVIDERIAYLVIGATAIIGFSVVSASLWGLSSQIGRLVEMQSISPLEKKSVSNTPVILKADSRLLTVKLKINSKKQRIFDGEAEVPQEISIFEMLNEIKDTNELDIEYQATNNKTVIKSINGVETGQGYALSYYINGEEVQGDIKDIKVKAGDMVEIITL